MLPYRRPTRTIASLSAAFLCDLKLSWNLFGPIRLHDVNRAMGHSG
jgi:hypothetical protein